MLQKTSYERDTYFVVTGAVNEKNGANGSMIDLIMSLEKMVCINIITLSRPPLIGLLESVLTIKKPSYSIFSMSICQYIFKKPAGIFFIGNTTEKKIIYFKEKYPNSKLMIFQTGDVRNTQNALSKYTLVDNVLFESPGQMLDFNNLYKNYQGKSLLLSPTIKEKKFFQYQNKSFSNGYLENNEIIKFVIIGSIQERKNQLQAIQVCQILKENYNLNLKLLVVGPFVNIKYEQNIKNFIKNNSLENLVEFTGFKKEYAKYLVNSPLVLSFSKEEGLSTIIRESLYLEKLIIATNIAGNIGTLDEDNSIVINLDDSNQLIANHIFSVLTDKEKVKNIIQNAKSKYLESHTSEHYLKQLEEIICNAAV